MPKRPYLLLALLPGILAGPARAADAPAAPRPSAEEPAPGPKPEERTLLLTYHFREGATRACRFTLDGKGTMTPAGAGIALPLSLGAELNIEQKVVRVLPDGSAEVESRLTFKRIRLNDVDLPGALPAPRSVSTLMAPSGQVLAVRAAADAPPGGAIPGVDAAALARLTQRLAFPDRPIRVGESWSDEPAPGAATDYRTTTTLAGLEKDGSVARLKQTLTMPLKTTAPNPLAGGAMEVTGKQAADLAIRFDVEAGAICDVTGTLDSDMTLTPAQGARILLRLKCALRMEPL